MTTVGGSLGCEGRRGVRSEGVRLSRCSHQMFTLTDTGDFESISNSLSISRRLVSRLLQLLFIIYREPLLFLSDRVDPVDMLKRRLVSIGTLILCWRFLVYRRYSQTCQSL